MSQRGAHINPMKYLDRIRSRGPNEIGQCQFDLGPRTLSLAMARLSIIDFNAIGVPYRYPDLDVCLVMNGEIFNWIELASRYNLKLKTACDAEVVAHLWRMFGPSMLEKLNGMFAIALHDTRTQTTFLARDRAGIKPLYYCESGDRTVFASEIKALPTKLIQKPCSDYEVFEFDCLEETMFEGVRRFLPGYYGIIGTDGRLKTYKWWSLPMDTLDIDEEEATPHLLNLLQDSISLRWPKSEPAAIMLSGGLDSSIIQNIVDSSNLYCVSFPEIDNHSIALKASNGKHVHKITFDREELESSLERVAYALDTPATWTAVCEYFLFQKIADDGIRIALSGEGADEIFHGYTRYRLLHWLERSKTDILLKDYAPTREFLHGTDTSILTRLLNRGSTPKSIERAFDIVERHCDPSLSLVRNMARIEFHTTMQVLLRMPDRMAGLHSMENRTPFLDYRIMEFGTRLPDHLKMNDLASKDILRKVSSDLGLHPDIICETTKRGLAIPFASWYGPTGGNRGKWDRSVFKKMMFDAWAKVFKENTSCRFPSSQ